MGAGRHQSAPRDIERTQVDSMEQPIRWESLPAEMGETMAVAGIAHLLLILLR